MRCQDRILFEMKRPVVQFWNFSYSLIKLECKDEKDVKTGKESDIFGDEVIATEK